MLPYYLLVTVTSTTYYDIDEVDHPILIVSCLDRTTREQAGYALHTMWETNGITFHGFAPFGEDIEYIFSKRGEYPTLREVHLLMIEHDKRWIHMVGATEEMVRLHKLLWEL